MIKINLLPQKRPKHRGVAGPVGGSRDNAGKQLALGIGAVLGVFALVFFIFDLPKRSKKSDYESQTKQLNDAINSKQGDLQGYEGLKQQEAEVISKIQSIEKLDQNKVVPAHVLHEIGFILSTRGPTMTDKRRLEVKNSSKQYQEDWDPSHVWLTSFNDTRGAFKLEGGAQSRDDITQLSKRIAASMYFYDVELTSGEPVVDRETRTSYYKFLITGKVAY
jgi:Tfp pilus assembly protein PilN